jgi:hypothetical protein
VTDVEQSETKLVFTTGKLAGRSFDLTAKAVVLGRAGNIAIRLPDGKVSREHTKIYRQGVEWYAIDLNSRNGTQVNGAKITKRLLSHGDELLIGETVMRFENPPVAKKTPPRVTPPRETAVREVVDLSGAAPASPPRPSAPAGAMDSSQIVIKDRALQFSKHSARRKPSLLFDDLGQRSMVYQVLIGLVVLAISAAFLIAGLYLGGVVGTD